jgi:ATP-dependent Lon protease
MNIKSIYSNENEYRAGMFNRNEGFEHVSNIKSNSDGVIKTAAIELEEIIIFPEMISPIFITNNWDLSAIIKAQENNKTIIGLIKKKNKGPQKSNTYLRTGIEIAVGSLLEMPDGTHSALVQGRRRVKILKTLKENGKNFAEAEPVIETIKNISNKDHALINATKTLFENVVQHSRSIPEEANMLINSITSPGWLADMVSAAIALPYTKRVEILEMHDVIERLTFVYKLLKNELDILHIEEEMRTNVQREVDKSQRDFYLREQVKAINIELGEGDIWEEEINGYEKRIEDENLPKEVKATLKDQIKRLTLGPSLSPESSIVRKYIEWLLTVPWKEKTTDNLNIQHIEKILNKNHCGLEKPKERLLEFIAVEKLRSEHTKQPIMCFIGPPGTGKTSFGLSVAEALGRVFVRISLGGIRDEAEIRGHRRTYIGALPGRIIQTMKRAKTTNPIFMLDEIDKIGNDYRGDPGAALLEILDSEQNKTFSDHYLEIPYDLSNVFFITTANSTDKIPPALLDRMEIVEFSGYVMEEKVEIALEHLIPKQIIENSLSEKDIVFNRKTLEDIIQNYTYESGVRNLERQIGKLCRKITKQKIENIEKISRKLTPNAVENYLGPPQYFPFKAENVDEIGVATAVAWTENGGEIMPVEVSVVEGKGNLNITGQVGEIMQESAQAALTFIKSRVKIFNIKIETFEKVDIHIHVPEGAVQKDGPSGGITLCLAMISALTKRKTFHDIGLTGEITLRGKILPVGGLREKILAAHRSGLKKIIIPKKNIKDLVKINKKVEKELEVIPVDHMDDVIKIALEE